MEGSWIEIRLHLHFGLMDRDPSEPYDLYVNKGPSEPYDLYVTMIGKIWENIFEGQTIRR